MHRIPVPAPLTTLATERHDGGAGTVPLVLGHGILLDSHIWSAVLPAFADRTVVTVDGPGHGASGSPATDWDLRAHVHALIAVLDRHGLDRAVLAGHSWGGMVALRTALAHPDRVAGLGLVNTPLTPAGPESRARFRAQQALLHATGPSTFFARRAAAALYAPASLRHHPEFTERMVRRLRGRPRRDLTRAISAVILRPGSALPRLGGLSMPVTVVTGEQDYVLPPATRAAVVAALPGAEITVARGGHVSPEEDPAAVVTALGRLLAAVDRR
ncbi:alpha/beta fold hydrolase [Micromonospora sp. BQ11]|uniref:alpha/beta fold hydrolase n=1 Tax=Micromonospora sp. BQ11 TaxID=3452212 RepID=UPI003F897E05